jgi:hypothetical protein
MINNKCISKWKKYQMDLQYMGVIEHNICDY